MKYLAWMIGIVIFVIVSLFVVFFTSFGNTLLKPIIEAKIKQQTHLASHLEVFELSVNDFEIILDLNANNTIILKGNYSLFSQKFNVVYTVKLDELHTLKPLTSTALQGALFTEGKVVGDMEFIDIDGFSDVAKGKTSYHVELSDFRPTSIVAKVEHLSLASLLYMGVQKQYAHAKIDLDVNFKGLKEHALDGDIKLSTKDGMIDTQVMHKDFNLTLPKTSFSMNLDAKLKGDTIDYSYFLESNLAKIASRGSVLPEPLLIDIHYALDIQKLALLKPTIGVDLRGNVKIDGKVKGDKKKITVDAQSDIAASESTFYITLKELKLANFQADIQNLDLSKLLYMFNQPHYTDGKLFLKADIKDLESSRYRGDVKTEIKNGVLDSEYLSKIYEFESAMPHISYKVKTLSTLNGNTMKSKIDLNSTLASVYVKEALYNLFDSSLLSDYTVSVPSLNKLYFLTQRKLRGSLVAKGEIKKAKDLDLSVHSKIAGGSVNAHLHNDDFRATLNSLETLDILHILIYPEVFQSKIDGKLRYNLASSKGSFSGHLVNGRFQKNRMLSLLKQYTKTDLYVEKFTGDVNAKINKEKILASLDLISNKSAIKTKNTKLNTKTKKIDSVLTVIANTYPVIITLKGDVMSPKIGVDVQKLIESKTGDVIKKEVKKLIQGLF